MADFRRTTVVERLRPTTGREMPMTSFVQVKAIAKDQVPLLSTYRGVRLAVALNARPWELDLEALVVSASHSGLGQLGAQLRAALPKVDWSSADRRELTPSHPVVLRVPKTKSRSHLRRIVLASARRDVGPFAEGPGSLVAASTAAEHSVHRAAAEQCRSVGVPLLGAGAIGMPARHAAGAVVEGVLAAIRGLPAEALSDVVFVCRDEGARRAITMEWDCQELLVQARRQVLEDPEILREADKAGVTDEQLADALDVDERDLWAPCVSSLQRLRDVEADLERLSVTVPGVAARGGAEVDWADGGGARSPAERQLRQQEETRGRVQARLLGELRDLSLLPRLRERINSARQQAMSGRSEQRADVERELGAVGMHALRLPPSRDVLVQTSARRELLELVQPAAGVDGQRGSVGVAGPRGAGKTTLLRHVHDTWTKGVRVFVPAPASYVSRDFLLYLYGVVCDEVLAADPAAHGMADRTASRRDGTAGLLGLYALATLCLIAGLTGLAVFALGQELSASEMRGLGLVLFAAAVIAALCGLWDGSGRLHQLERAAARAVTALPLRAGVRVLAVIAIGGLLLSAAAASFISLKWGLACTLVLLAAASLAPGPLAAESAAPSGGRALHTARRLASRSVAAVRLWAVVVAIGLAWDSPSLEAVDVELLTAGLLVSAGAAALLHASASTVAVGAAPFAAVPPDAASRKAFQARERIQYQRSVMHGQAATAKVDGRLLPFGIDVQRSASTTHTDAPLGVPEIVAGIKDLLRDERCQPALIAIDELDKIESVEKARDFLNEIKGLLDAPGTYFLLSMSEDAIASFERRGLPFRDVFDSAFDDVVRVSYLEFAQARALLDQRVTDVPRPFLALAHCLSGGLPRDLLRAASQVLKLPPGATAADLSATTRRVVHTELVAKTAAVTAAITSVHVEPAASSVLGAFRRLDLCGKGEGERGTGCLLEDQWLQPFDDVAPLLMEASTDRAERQTLLRLSVELLGYYYYCRSLLELFDLGSHSTVERLLDVLDDADALDELAHARQTFAVNPFVAWEQVTAVRGRLRLTSFALPFALRVQTGAVDVSGDVPEGSAAGSSRATSAVQLP